MPRILRSPGSKIIQARKVSVPNADGANASGAGIRGPYRRPIRATAISAISRGSLGPDAPTSRTLRATISQSGSLRSTTPSQFRAWLKALFKSSISSGARLPFSIRLIGIVPPSADATKTRTPSYSTGTLFTVGELRKEP